MKKIIRGMTILLLVALLVLLLPACSKPAPTPTPTPTPSPSPTQSPTPAPTAKSTFPAPKMDVKMPEFLSLLGGGSETSLYTLTAKSLEKRMRELWPTTSVRTELSNSVSTITRLDKQESVWGVSYPAVPLDALKGGTKSFPTPVTNFRVIANIPDVLIQPIVTIEKTGITGLSQLRNKRVGVGTAGATSVLAMEELFKKCYGFSYDDIKAAGGTVYTGEWGEMFGLVASGDLDAVLDGVPLPSSNVIQLAATNKVVFLDLPADYDSKNTLPGYSRATQPAGTYSWYQKPAYGFGTTECLFVPSSFSDDVVYNLLAAFYVDNAAYFRELAPAWKTIELVKPNIKGQLMKWFPDSVVHPGAKKFWAEVEKNVS